MGLNSTANADRVHISFFGCRNAGKSSLVNALTAQQISVVSEVAGTTTDPVNKAMEILPLGPVLITDTPGFDDEGMLGEKRIAAARRILAKTDIGVLVIDSCKGPGRADEELLSLFREKKMPYIVVLGKCDLVEAVDRTEVDCRSELKTAVPEAIYVSAKTGQGIEALKAKLGSIKPESGGKKLLAGLVKTGDVVVLVTPIDESAPRGRLILPQQQVLRALLDEDCTALVCQPEQLGQTLEGLKAPPDLVITDSQVFRKVAEILPEDIPLTSFSIIFAEYKGNLKLFLDGAEAIRDLQDGDRVLISEGCTHHRQCNDIGKVKIPAWIQEFTGTKASFEFSSGGDFPADLSRYKLVIHCGGCMLNAEEMKHRLGIAADQGIPIVNYGIAIALLNGVLERVYK